MLPLCAFNTYMLDVGLDVTGHQKCFKCLLCFPCRAKLADWLASKGKTLKNPAMTSAAPPKTKVCAKPKADLKPQCQPAAQCKPEPEPEPSRQAHKPDSAAAALCAVTQGAELTTQGQTPEIMNTTLDLLENSDAALPVIPQEGVEDVRKQTSVAFFK